MFRIRKSVALPVSVVCLLLLMVVGGALAVTRDVEGVVEPLQDGYLLIPLPQQVKWLELDFALSSPVTIVVADDAEGPDLYGPRDLQMELGKLGVETIVRRASEVADVKGAIVLGEAKRHPLVAQLLAAHYEETDEELPSEGYRLVVTPDYTVIGGVDVRGTYWGVQTLRQLLAPTSEGPVARGVQIVDWPDYPIRALHMFAGAEPGDLQQQMIEDVMGRFKFNMLILQVDQAKWDSHPEIWAGQGPSKATLRRLAQAAEERMIEVVPQITTFGHMYWAFRNGHNTQYAINPNNPIVYDPFNPETYEFTKDFFDEAIELFQPKYFHIGHDEIRFYGPIPTGDLPFGQVFVDSVNYWYDYFAEQGIGTMIWADEARAPDVVPFLDQLPQDVVMIYWNYDMFNPEVPPMDVLTERGFPVIGGTWHDVRSTQKMVETGLDKGAVGMTGTTWAGFFPDRQTLYTDPRQYAVYVVDAELFWNARGRNVDDLPYDPGEILRRSLELEPVSEAIDGFTVDLSEHFNVNAAEWLATSTVQRVIDGVNKGRGAGELIVYTPEWGTRTQTNVWGMEATIEDGYVTSVGGNNSPIPRNGFVISNQGWIGEHAVLGAEVTIDGNMLIIRKGERTDLYRGIAALPKGLQRLGGVLFNLANPAENNGLDAVAVRGGTGGDDVPRLVRIPVGRKADALWFLHTVTHPLDMLRPVGMYQIEYADGTRINQLLMYGVNITAWSDGKQMNVLHPLAWAEGGGRINAMRWQNPHPDKEITAVRVQSQTGLTSLVLLGLSGEGGA